MGTVTTALILGAAVGLGVAMPLGAIGVLLLQTGMTAGWRPAAAGGLGAAAVDTVYAAAAVTVGTTAAVLLAGRERAVEVVGALVLGAVALRGLAALRAPAAAAAAAAAAADDVARLGAGAASTSRAGRAPGAPAAVTTPSPARVLLRFVGLTAVNPLTVVYFVAVAAGLAGSLGTTAARVAFVVGIGVASALWQLGLAAAGAVLGTRVPSAVRTGLTAAGHVVVGGFAVLLAVP